MKRKEKGRREEREKRRKLSLSTTMIKRCGKDDATSSYENVKACEKK